MNPEILRALRATLIFALALPACVDGAGSKTDACESSTPILDASGAATGYETCADGSIHRASVVATSDAIDGESCRGTEEYLDCTTDADCGGGLGSAHRCLHDDFVDMGGRVVVKDTGAGAGDGCFCAHACTTDADCGTGYACVPSGIVDKDHAWSTCEPATCGTDADCSSGECGLSSYNDGCSYDTRLTCRSGDDACRVAEDCTDGDVCASSYGDAIYDCRGIDCAIGRPLMVEGQPTTAPRAPRADWGCAPDVDAAPAEQAAALAAWWSEIGALEHASVASFARFTLELMSPGAPPALLAEVAAAMGDEVRHATLAFGLAGAWGGQPVGPGPLGGALAPHSDPEAILDALITEACVVETLGAAEARAAAEGVTDPELRAALSTVADDEARHAGLAWRSLRWILETRPELRARAAQTFAGAVAAMTTRPPIPSPDAPAQGVLSPAERRRVHLAALNGVVVPVVATLLG